MLSIFIVITSCSSNDKKAFNIIDEAKKLLLNITEEEAPLKKVESETKKNEIAEKDIKITKEVEIEEVDTPLDEKKVQNELKSSKKLKLKESKQIEYKPLNDLNFDEVSLEEISFKSFTKRWTNFMDVSTAIEIFSPVFQLYLTDDDHQRAISSLQFDETIGIYVSTLLGLSDKLVLVNNKHPMIPLSPFKSGFRLLLHGLSTEVLHAILQEMKQKQLK